MAHYAFLDENNVVVEVIPGIDEDQLIEEEIPEIWYGKYKSQKCLRTSYSGSIRKNFAGVGYTYNEDLDAFIPPKPYDSWVLDEETCHWGAPVALPDTENRYQWDEDTQEWVLYIVEEIPAEQLFPLRFTSFFGGFVVVSSYGKEK